MTPMRFRCCFHLAVTGELEMRSGGKKVKLTLCAWCAFVLQWRKGQDNALMHEGRLTQELAVHFHHSLLLHGNAAHTAHMKLGWINYADPLQHSYPHHRCYRCYTFTSFLVSLKGLVKKDSTGVQATGLSKCPLAFWYFLASWHCKMHHEKIENRQFKL